jgi:uncharacterized membrane protein YdjX (TVP38/TMEM64 family)
MKIILIILSVIQLIGIISSTYLAKSLALGLDDSKGGLITLAVLWGAYLLYKNYKKQKNESKQKETE